MLKFLRTLMGTKQNDPTISCTSAAFLQDHSLVDGVFARDETLTMV
jgi:hypothetical protein